MRKILFLFLAIATASAVGCSISSSGVGSLNEEAKGVSMTLENLNDNRTDAKAISQFFVQGTAMPDMKKLGLYSYSFKGSQSVSASPATLKVNVYDEMGGKDMGDFDWTFEKVGDRWKIKAIQLP